MLPALFIGRFQPFHLGHLDAVAQILTAHKKIIIAIGSSQYRDLPLNPFSIHERRQMIEESLAEAGIRSDRFLLVEIPDIHDDTAWISHLEALTPPFGAVYSGTPKVRELFKKNGSHPLLTPQFNTPISGTMIREKIAQGGGWEALVPKPVKGIIKNHHGN